MDKYNFQAMMVAKKACWRRPTKKKSEEKKDSNDDKNELDPTKYLSLSQTFAS
jgi:hypothetical protein